MVVVIYCRMVYICVMLLSERILRRLYPDRGEFSEGELSYVDAVLSAYAGERLSSERASALPLRYVEVGGAVSVSGYRLRCVERPRCLWPPSEACSGCALSRLYLGCAGLQCSSFDRRDGRNVWYVEESSGCSI